MSVEEAFQSGKFDERCIEIVGCNSNGSRVYKWTWNGSDYAVKSVPKLAGSVMDYPSISNISNVSIVTYHSVTPRQNDLYILQEWCSTSLRDFVEYFDFENVNVIHLLKSIAQGVEFLHGQKIIHGNLHPQNIFVFAESNQAKISLSDYPCKENKSTARHFLPDKEWAMPTSANLREKCDIFSMGCIFYYLLTEGKHPYGQVPEEREKLIARNLYCILLPEENCWSNLIELMVNIKSDDLTASQCVQFLEKCGKGETLEELKELIQNVEKPRRTGQIISSEWFFIPKLDLKILSGRFFQQYVNILDLCDDGNKLTGSNGKSLMQNIKELRTLSSHCGILKYLGCIQEGNSWKIIIEPFVDVLSNCYATLDKYNYSAKTALLEITEGLEFLHYHGFYHHCLIPENIVFIKDRRGFTVKIAKFPLEKKFEWSVGNKRSPESVDMFQLGFLFHFVLSCGKKLKPGLDKSCSLSNDLSYEEQHVINSMISDENELPTVEALLYHPFFWTERKMFDFLDALDQYLYDNNTEEREGIQLVNRICQNELWSLPTNLLNAMGSLDSSYQVQANNYCQADLVKLICLMGNNFNDLPKELQNLFGGFPVQYCQYWKTVLPRFLLSLWIPLQNVDILTRDDEMEEFFPPDYKFILRENKSEVLLYRVENRAACLALWVSNILEMVMTRQVIMFLDLLFKDPNYFPKLKTEGKKFIHSFCTLQKIPYESYNTVSHFGTGFIQTISRVRNNRLNFEGKTVLPRKQHVEEDLYIICLIVLWYWITIVLGLLLYCIIHQNDCKNRLCKKQRFAEVLLD